MKFLGLLLIFSAIGTSQETWQDVVDKFNKVKNALSGNVKEVKNEIQNLAPQIVENSRPFVDELKKSFNHTNYDKVHDKLQQLRKRVIENINASFTDNERNKVAELKSRIGGKIRQRIRELGDNIRQVNERSNITEDLYQLDVILTTAQLEKMESNAKGENRRKRQAYKDAWYPQTIWKDRVVYYYYDTGLGSDARSAIQKAIDFWHQNTCINFQENRSTRNRIRFFAGAGCYSYVGFIGGEQDVSIGKGCETVGTAAHEIGHALGFFHTQSRWDRDDFISLDRQNIAADYADQFDKETQATNYNYGMTYDWGSIMQYGAASASSNGKSTMIAKNANYQDTMGSDIVAFYDVSMMNEHYSCKADCPTSSSAKCVNGGYPHPRNCAICQCPRGFGGKLCDERPSGCGETVASETTSKTLQVSVGGGGGTRPRLEFDQCYYIITAPEGKKIEAKITSFPNPSCVDGCTYGGIEIKAEADTKITGYRYCCRDDVGQTVTSTSNVLPIIGYNRYGQTQFTIEYKYVDGGLSPGPVLKGLNQEADDPDPVPGDEKTTTTQRTTTTLRITTPKNSKCRDDRNCVAWVFYLRFCQTYPVFYQKRYCPHRCGFC